jgi:hypothetical protein
MGLQAPEGLLAIHTNMPCTVPPDVYKAAAAGDPPPAGLSAEERRAYEQLIRTFGQVEYARYMAARPQTLYGIADSPAGLAAWLLDHNDAGGQPAAAVVSALDRTTSATGELTREEILDNITFYWVTNTGVSASRLYWEYKLGFFDAKGVSIPVAASVFRASSTRRRAAGPNGPTPTSSTTTRSTGAATSPPGNNRNSSPKKSARRSAHCASRRHRRGPGDGYFGLPAAKARQVL